MKNKGIIGLVLLLWTAATVGGWMLAVRNSRSAEDAMRVADVRQQEVDRLNQVLSARERALAKLQEDAMRPPPALPDVPDLEKETLQREVEALRAQLAQLENTAAVTRPERGPANPGDGEQPRSREDWMERMRTEEPERYAEMQQRMQEMRTRMKDSMTQRSAYFAQLDISKMTPDQAKNHQELLQMMARGVTLNEQLEQNPDAETASAIRREIRENFGRFDELLHNERDVALNQLGTSLGFNNDDSTQLAEYVRNIYEMTSMRSMMGGGFSRGGRDGGRGGPGGGGPGGGGPGGGNGGR